jgi:hypothetical protein
MADEPKPITFYTQRDPDTGRHGTLVHNLLGVEIRRSYVTHKLREIEMLMVEPGLRCDYDEIVRAGYFSVEDMIARGVWSSKEEQRAARARHGAPEPKPEAKPKPVKKPEPEYPAFPDFSTMYAEELWDFWNNESPSTAKRRATAPIGFPSSLSKKKMLEVIRKELTKREDPRVDTVRALKKAKRAKRSTKK